MLENVDIRILPHFGYEAFLDFKAGIVGMVENTEFRMASLAVEVECAVRTLVEIHAPFHELFYLSRSTFHHLFHGGRVAEVVAGHHCIGDMFVEIVYKQVGYRSHSSLGEGCVGLFKSGFTYYCHTVLFRGNLQGETHSGDAGSYHEIVVAVCHFSDWL